MSVEIIRVEPAPERRQCFARWAVAQTPKIRTADFDAFAVPSHLFTEAPECILIGALVDGHLYVPVEDDHEGAEAPDDGLRWAEPGEPLPPVPESAYGPDSVPLDYAPTDGDGDEDGARDSRDPGEEVPARPDGTYTVLLAAGDSDSSDSGDEDPSAAGDFPCDVCSRSFTTSRGRDTHSRQIHADSRS